MKEKYGDWALITGASAGIGEEFAKQLAKKGMNLILVARRLERLNKIKEELEADHGIKIVAAQIDLLNENFLTDLIRIVENREVGLLINNAGFGYRGEYINLDPQKEIEMVKVNCLAPTILSHYFITKMIERKKGAVIFLGSLVAFTPTPQSALYSATKAFNSFMGEALWYELKKHNIDVLALNPGGTDTEFQKVAGSTTGPVPRTAEQVVRTALNALGKKTSVVDGFYNKFLAVSSKFITRRMAVTIAGKISEWFY